MQRVRPTPPPEPVTRFETPAGRQAQVDFARFRFAWGVLYALLVVLGHSRLLWCWFYTRQDMATLMDGLEEAFLAFGGVSQELLFDQRRRRSVRSRSRQDGAPMTAEDRVQTVVKFGFTERQARFLVSVVLHSGACLQRQDTKIVHGKRTGGSSGPHP